MCAGRACLLCVLSNCIISSSHDFIADTAVDDLAGIFLETFADRDDDATSQVFLETPEWVWVLLWPLLVEVVVRGRLVRTLDDDTAVFPEFPEEGRIGTAGFTVTLPRLESFPLLDLLPPVLMGLDELFRVAVTWTGTVPVEWVLVVVDGLELMIGTRATFDG